MRAARAEAHVPGPGRSLPIPKNVATVVAHNGAGESTSGIARGLEAELLCRVRIQQVRLEHAVLDENGTARGNAFSIERAGAESTGNRAVINDVYVVARDLLAELAGEK